MDKLIFQVHNSLSKSFCDHLINKFEQDDNKGPGVVASGGSFTEGNISSIKKSTDLYLTRPTWTDEIQLLTSSLDKGIVQYHDTYLKDYNVDYFQHTTYIGFQIQRTNPGEYYKWHHDFASIDPKYGNRLITYIWYLNDITSGGQTEFYDGTKIVPETGKLLLFPATWTYLHQGLPPEKEIKYIVTGWFYVR